MPAERPGNQEEHAARALIEQAGKALSRGRPEIPASFVAQLYGRSVPEDLVRYGADDLAALAEHAYEFMSTREPGTSKVRCETVPLTASGERKSVSLIEIVNDDMPFLVDSVMGEIADRRLDVRLVTHPIFSVRRDGNKLTALDGPEAGGKRESLISIHLAPIADAAAREELVRALEVVLGRGAAGGAGLARHARPRQRHCDGTEDKSAAAPRR